MPFKSVYLQREAEHRPLPVKNAPLDLAAESNAPRAIEKNSVPPYTIDHRIDYTRAEVCICYQYLTPTLALFTGERPYRCPVDGCSKAFRQLSSLQQHLKGHNIPLPKSYPVTRAIVPPPAAVSARSPPSSESPPSGNESFSKGNRVSRNYHHNDYV